MRLLNTLGLGALAAGVLLGTNRLAAGPAGARTAAHPPFTAVLTNGAALLSGTNHLFLLPPGARTNFYYAPPVLPKPPAPAIGTNPPSRSPVPLKPGVYQTAPFSLIVVVPRSHFDEGMLHEIPAKGVDPNMPCVKPGLRFLPIR